MKYLAIFGIPLAILVIVIMTLWSYNNAAVDKETRIDAMVSENQTVLSAMSNTVFEQLGIAKQYKGAVVEVIKAGIEGRYGASGSKALLQAMTEAYPATLDANAFIRIQNTIEAKRNEFQNSQKKLIDMVASYKNSLRKLPGKYVYSMLDYPTIDMTLPKYNPIISSSTVESFNSGLDNGMNLNP